MKTEIQKQLQDEEARQELDEILAFCDGANAIEVLFVHTPELAD